MILRQNGRTWIAELSPVEKALLKQILPQLLEEAGRVAEIRDPQPRQWWMEVDLELKRPVAFNAPHDARSVHINRDGGGVTYDGSRAWYRLGFYPMPMPGDTKITIRIDPSVDGQWWPEDGPNVRIEDVHEQIRLLGQAIAIGWDPIGQPRVRH